PAARAPATVFLLALRMSPERILRPAAEGWLPRKSPLAGPMPARRWRKRTRRSSPVSDLNLRTACQFFVENRRLWKRLSPRSGLGGQPFSIKHAPEPEGKRWGPLPERLRANHGSEAVFAFALHRVHQLIGGADHFVDIGRRGG